MALQQTLWRVNRVFAKFSLVACIKGGLENQGFPVGYPLAPQSPLSDEGREVVALVLRAVDLEAEGKTTDRYAHHH